MMIPNLQLDSPALHWTDGYVLGNGDVGAVVWGTAERVCIGLSKHDVNDLRGPEPHGARPKATYPEIRDRFLRGERAAIRDLAQVNAGVRPGQQQIACGRLSLELLRETQPLAFTQSLSLEKAEVAVEVCPTTAGRSFGMSYQPTTLRVRVAAERNLVMVELASESEQCVRWGYDRSPDLERPPARFVASPVPMMHHELPCGTEYAVAIAAMAPDTLHAEATTQGLAGTIRFGGTRGPVTILIGMASDGDAGRGSVASLATRLVTGLETGELDTLVQKHHEWWRRFWAASRIEYADEDLERLWYAGLYALGASTRPDTSPPNLQGIWVQDEISPWHTDFHFNTNVQECQWAAGASNHPELQQALVRVLTHDWRRELERTGQEVYGVAAPAPYLGVDWRGRAISTWGFLELSVPAWTAQHLWEQYLHTQDLELLRHTIYPYLLSCAELYLALLVEDEAGQLNIELSHSPEQIWFENGQRYFAYGRNPSIDLSCIQTLFAAVVDAARDLEDSAPLAATCREALERLAPLPTHDGVLIDYEAGFFHDGDRPGQLRHCHRHPSRLMPIFPGRQIGLHSPSDLLALGRRSFAEFRSYGEDGFTGWSYAYQACIAARLGLADEAEQCLHTLISGYLFKGMLTSHNSMVPGVGNYDVYGGSPLFQLDALLGSVAALNEMLVQRTADGVIRVFPAVPDGRAASFESLRVPGAVLVSAATDGNSVKYVTIRPERNGELALACPWPDGAGMADCPDVHLADDGTTFRWSGMAGTTYRFAPRS
jgi:hypothetical protein